MDFPLNELMGTFRESEGLTLIAKKELFQKEGVEFLGPFAKLTIDVHTSLELVGLTAVLAKRLVEEQISANVIAGYFHDHIFFQYDLRHKATKALESLKNKLST